jgi:hypothetical protein
VVFLGLDVRFLGGKSGRKISSMENDLDSWSCEVRIKAFSAGLQPAEGWAVVTWGVAPGYGGAGLQPAEDWFGLLGDDGDDIEIEGKADCFASLRNGDLGRQGQKQKQRQKQIQIQMRGFFASLRMTSKRGVGGQRQRQRQTQRTRR